MQRKLASIQTVKGIVEIPKADRLEALKILGWTVVDEKGLYRKGSRVVYCEIDSLMPPKHFPILEKFQYRINTVKLRGQVSQGYPIPMERFLQIAEAEGYQHEILEGGDELLVSPRGESILLTEGLEVTGILGITKWEPPAHLLQGEFCGGYPSHLLSKSGEIRMQAVPEVVDELQGKPYVITVKCDGESGAYVIDFGEFCCCAAENKRSDGDNVYWNIARKYKIKEILEANPGYAIQGEHCGPGIRGNKLGLKEHDFFVYNIVRLEDRKKLGYFEMKEFCDRVGLKVVPLLEHGVRFSYSFDQLLELADGFYAGTQNRREGIVVRAEDYNLYSEVLLDNMSFKIISNKFLLNGGC